MEIKFIDRKTGELRREAPPAEGLLHFLYDNPFGKTAILPIAKRKFISAIYGKRMDSPSSINRIQTFVSQLGIDMTESKKSVAEFKSFNDFFYRELLPEARPIQEGFISPGDGRLLAFERVSDVNTFFVKGRQFTLAEFLGDEELAAAYQDATLLILRLAPNDYHRFHFPWDGVPSDIRKIKGSYYSVSPYALAGNFTRVFCENKREFCLLKTKEKGNVLLAPIGATMVGGIVETYQPEQRVDKGAEMGYFKFGGSTVLILVDSDKIKIDPDILHNTRSKLETYVKMGERIGQ